MKKSIKNRIVIVHGPQKSGKTRHREQIKTHYGCSRIVDDWDGRAPLRAGDLALTNDSPPFATFPHPMLVLDFQEAKKAAYGIKA